MKIIIAVDKFKGSLTCFEAGEAIAEGIRRADNGAEIFSFPMADGGDGFAAVMQHYLHTTSVACETVDPLGKKIIAGYQWQETTATAIIETAAASGLVLLRKQDYDPLRASTYGTGLLLRDAARRGARKIVLGLGGSATNDAGTGILQALGFGFRDAEGKELPASGANLSRIRRIIAPPHPLQTEIAIACDVRNPLYGPNGAAYVYAPQKGADESAVKALDEGLKNFAEIVRLETGRNIDTVPGSGAAGGIAAGLLSFLNARICEGIDLIVNHSKITEQLNAADLLITGEGKIDDQSGEGKVVGRMARLAGQYGVPVIGLCGIAELDGKGAQSLGLKDVFPLCTDRAQAAACMENAFQLLSERAEEAMMRYR